MINHLTDGGPKATIIRVATEAIRRLFTDHHIGAKVQVDGALQIQAYRGAGNRCFFLSNCKIFSESPGIIVSAIKSAYRTADFTLWQCTNSAKVIKRDAFFIQFCKPPAFMPPADSQGKFRSPMCGSTVNYGPCPNHVEVYRGNGGKSV